MPSPTLISIMESPSIRNFSAKDLVARLASTELFAGLDDSILQDIASGVESKFLPARGILFSQGDPGDGLYIVITGRLRVIVEREGSKKEEVAEIGRGEMVGEIALLTGENRSATVQSVRDTYLVKFSRDLCHRLVEKSPSIMIRIAEVIAKRLGSTNRRRTRTAISNIALIPIQPDFPLSDFTTRLSSALDSLGSTVHLSRRWLESMWGKAAAQASLEDMGSSRVDDWLDDQEKQCKFVLYEADPLLSPWTKRCVRHADHIVLLGRAGGDSGVGEIERALLNQDPHSLGASQTLVLIHQDGHQRPSLTLPWLAARNVERHFHLRWNMPADFDRLARFLGGCSTGLVLGGGGARGFAHIGVIQALKETGIQIDFIGGTSMGAVISGEYAFGLDRQEMIRFSKELFHRSSFDYTLPFTALISARRFNKKLSDAFGNIEIEDLWTPYFCVSANLSRAEVVVHRSGLLWRGIRASCSLPGITPPILYKGDLIVDGGLLNNLPIDIMSKFYYGGPIIAVDVSAQIDLADNLQYGDSLSGWQTLWSRLNPFSSSLQVPNIAALLGRSGELATVHGRRTMLDQYRADLYLCPPVKEFGTLQFELIEEIVNVGYQSTLKQIEEWHQKEHCPC